MKAFAHGFRGLVGPLVLRPAARDRLRFFLTVSGIAVGVATIAAIRLANASVLSSFSSTVDFVAGMDFSSVDCLDLPGSAD